MLAPVPSTALTTRPFHSQEASAASRGRPPLSRAGCRQAASGRAARALETAQELCRHVGLPETALLTCDQLEPGVSSKKLMKRLRSLEANEVVLVGHAPDLAEHAAWLIGSKRCQVEIAKAGLAFVR